MNRIRDVSGLPWDNNSWDVAAEIAAASASTWPR